jgi:hypothetical protein
MTQPSNRIRFVDPAFPLKNLTIRILPDGKILLKFGDERGIHYTLHPGTQSEKIDFHKTDERFPRSDPRRHEKLVEIPKSAVEAELHDIDASFANEMLALWHPIRLGWMARRQLAIGPPFPSAEQLEGIKSIDVREGPTARAVPMEWMRPPVFYYEVLERPNVGYFLFDAKRASRPLYGTLIAYRNSYGGVSVMWARLRDINRWAKKWEPFLLARWQQLLVTCAPANGDSSGLPLRRDHTLGFAGR